MLDLIIIWLGLSILVAWYEWRLHRVEERCEALMNSHVAFMKAANRDFELTGKALRMAEATFKHQQATLLTLVQDVRDLSAWSNAMREIRDAGDYLN